MISIQKNWPDFDQNGGQIDINGFQQIMILIAEEQGLFEGDPDQVKQNKCFFTPENLQKIFNQILSQEENENDDFIPHTTVVDILYNVIIQIEEN